MEKSVTGTTCPACGGRLAPTEGDEYECEDCGYVAEITDMYMP